MAEKDKDSLKKTFNENASETEYTVIFEPEFLGEFQDNTDPRHEPKSVPNTQHTPSGTNSNFSPKKQTVRPSSDPQKPSHEDVQHELLNGEYSVEQKINGFTVRAKIDDAPSKAGLNGGTISRLVLTTGDRGNEEIHSRFEKGGWETEMKTGLERQTAMEAMREYDPDCLKKKDRSEQPEGDKSQKKGRDKGDDFTR